jgi:hypothetical protein
MDAFSSQDALMKQTYKTESEQSNKLTELLCSEFGLERKDSILFLLKMISYQLLNTEYNVLRELFGTNQGNRLLLRKLYTVINGLKSFNFFQNTQL